MLENAAAESLRTQLRELPELVVYTHMALTPGATARGPRVSGGTRTAPLPCTLDALSLLGPGAPGEPDETDTVWPVHTVLSTWARIICIGTGSCLLTTNLQDLTHILLRELPWAVQQPWADQLADQIAELHRQLRRFAPARPRRRELALPCPRCQLLTLSQQDGEDARCGNPGCGVILRPAEYDDRAEQYLAELVAA